MFPKNAKSVSFYSVALAIITAGVIILGVGIAFYALNLFADYQFASPSTKIIGGLIILALGYIHLELELIRQPKEK